MTNSGEGYIEFLERQFAQDSGGAPPSLDQLQAADVADDAADQRWLRAAEALAPRSIIGSLFGVSLADIRRAAWLLSGTPQFGPISRIVRRMIDLAVAVALLAGLKRRSRHDWA